MFHNTVLAGGNVRLSIEVRFATAGGEVRSNLADAPIGADEFSVAFLPGDVDGNGQPTLIDAILTMQILTGGSSNGIHLEADVNGDGQIGHPEVLSILEELAILPGQ
jgi:hypothetical protein